jgi:magnesium chelatase subunit D
MTHFKTYPFTAIIGQDLMKLALILNAINPKIGGVLIKGTKGTAKSTAVRALADLLPEIKVVKDCSFNCNPDDQKEACHPCQHRIMDDEIAEKDIELRTMRVINLPINATEDRVIGTINIEKALTLGIKALEPGILADSHRNILYIDEVNLLADNVADVLLDAAAMGINIIEREGISIHHPANFILVGTMNPEEGNLRPQLLDRFGLSVTVAKISVIKQRVQIIKNSEHYHMNPQEFHDKFKTQQEELRNKIINARKILPEVSISDEMLEKIAEICIIFDTDGHRADISISLTAKTIAALDGRIEVSLIDVKKAAQLALPHRMRRLPFEDDTLDEDRLDEIINQPKSDETEQNNQEIPPKSNNKENQKNQKDQKDQKENPTVNGNLLNKREEIFDVDHNKKVVDLFHKKRIKTPMNAAGNQISHPTKNAKGKYIGAIKKIGLNIPHSHDVAIIPTINSAALNQKNNNNKNNNSKDSKFPPNNNSDISYGNAITIQENNIYLKKREGKSSYLIIFCVDASGSMGVQDRMKIVKGIIFNILQQNYVNRDKVSLVVFRQEKAEVILPPTRSPDLAHKLLQKIPTGGTTPLASGLLKAFKVATDEIKKDTGYIPLIILLSDARGNIFFNDAIDDVVGIGYEIAKANIETIIIDTENSEVCLGISKQIAEAANATYYHMDSLNEDAMGKILQKEGLINLA